MNKGATGKPSVLKVKSADIIYPDELKPGDLKFEPFPPPISEKDEFSEFQIEQHEGEVTWTARIQLKEGVDPAKANIEVTYSGQVCSQACISLDPRTMTAAFGGMIEPPTGEFQPQGNELTWKAHLEPKVVVPGGKAKLVFEAIPKNGFHFYPAHRSDGI